MQDRQRASEIFIARQAGPNNPESWMPINIDRLLWQVKRDFKVDKKVPTALSPKKVIEKVRNAAAPADGFQSFYVFSFSDFFCLIPFYSALLPGECIVQHL